MTLFQIRCRINALKRRFARELAIVKLRRIAEAVSDQWDPDRPPEPADVIGRIADAGFRLSTFTRLSRYLKDTRRQGELPEPESIVLEAAALGREPPLPGTPPPGPPAFAGLDR